MPDQDDVLSQYVAAMGADLAPALQALEGFLVVFRGVTELVNVGKYLVAAQQYGKEMMTAIDPLREEWERVQEKVVETRAELANLRLRCIEEAEAHRVAEAEQLVRHQEACSALQGEHQQTKASMAEKHARMVDTMAAEIEGLSRSIEQKTMELNGVEGRLSALKQFIGNVG